jgi:hypothetical protein
VGEVGSDGFGDEGEDAARLLPSAKDPLSPATVEHCKARPSESADPKTY